MGTFMVRAFVQESQEDEGMLAFILRMEICLDNFGCVGIERCCSA